MSITINEAIQIIQNYAEQMKNFNLTIDDLEIKLITDEVVDWLYNNPATNLVSIFDVPKPFNRNISVTGRGYDFISKEITDACSLRRTPFFNIVIISGTQDRELSYPEANYIAGLLNNSKTNVNVPRYYHIARPTKKDQKLAKLIWNKIENLLIR